MVFQGNHGFCKLSPSKMPGVSHECSLSNAVRTRLTRGAAIGSSSPNGGDGVIRGTIFAKDKRMRTTHGGSGTEDMLLVISLAMLLVMIWTSIWCDLLDTGSMYRTYFGFFAGIVTPCPCDNKQQTHQERSRERYWCLPTCQLPHLQAKPAAAPATVQPKFSSCRWAWIYHD